jgi:hypothetical protein
VVTHVNAPVGGDAWSLSDEDSMVYVFTKALDEVDD